MPVRNESRYLDTLLNQVVSQTYSANRIYIVVAPSDDDTLDKARRHARTHAAIEVLENLRGTAPHGMNLALELVTADAWVRIDGHTEIPLDLLQVLREELNDKAVACVGPMLRAGARTRRQRAIGLAMSSPLGVGNARFRTGRGGSGPTDAVAFGLYRRSVTDVIGQYETEMDRNQDDLFNTRLRQDGHTLWLTDKTTIVYFPRMTFTALAQQYFQYGQWRVYGTLRHGNEMRARQVLPSTLVLLLGLSIFLLFSSPKRFMGWATPLAYSSVIASQVVREKKRGATALVAFESGLAVTAMHVAYGVGSFKGIIAAVRRNER